MIYADLSTNCSKLDSLQTLWVQTRQTCTLCSVTNNSLPYNYNSYMNSFLVYSFPTNAIALRSHCLIDANKFNSCFCHSRLAGQNTAGSGGRGSIQGFRPQNRYDKPALYSMPSETIAFGNCLGSMAWNLIPKKYGSSLELWTM